MKEIEKRLCLEEDQKKIVKMTKSFVNMKSWKKSRYMLPKTAFVAATFCMLYMAYNPSASSSSKGLSSKQGPLSMSQAELDSLYKGHRSVFVNFCPVLVEFFKGVSVVEKLMDNSEHPAKTCESLIFFPSRTEDHAFWFGF